MIKKTEDISSQSTASQGVSDRTLAKADEMLRVFRAAVKEAQAESRRLGVANVYSVDGRIVYELPDGTMTEESPY